MITQMRIQIWLNKMTYKVWPFALRGELFRMLYQNYPELHSQQPKPFAIGRVIQQGQSVHWELNVLNPRWLEVFTQYLVLGRPVGFEGEVQGRITLVQVMQQHTFEGLLTQPWPQQLELTFETTTAVSSGGMDWDRPVPALLWHGLSERWNLLAQQMQQELEAGAPMQTPPGLKDWVSSHLMCLNYKIRPSVMKLGGQNQLKGFVGKANYGFRGTMSSEVHQDYARWVNALAHYATFAGVGVKTVYGCGVVRLG